MTTLLAGDIGGTKTVLRLVNAQSGSSGSTKLETLYHDRFISAEFPDLVPMVQQFLAAAKAELDIMPSPERACFAIAGPVVNNTSRLTNLSWFLETDRLEQQLHVSQVSLINDFEAIGYGVFGLEPEDICTLQPGSSQADAPIAIIGAGTGLGQGFSIPHGHQHWIFPSEGGHADFAPRSALEFQLLQYLLEKHDIQRVSVERVVSGQGLVSIYQFLRDHQRVEESPTVSEHIRQWEREIGKAEKSVDPGAVISKAALEDDRLCKQAMELFVEAYGAEAGNLALKLLPFGGLYVAGGIAAKNLPFLNSGHFIHAFLNKGRMSELLEKVPVHVVLNPHVGLIGAALRAAR